MTEASFRLCVDSTMGGMVDSERGGVYQYLAQLLDQMLALEPQHDWRLFFALPNPRHRTTIDAFVQRIQAHSGCEPRVSRGWLPLRLLRHVPLPVECFTGSLDLFHAPAHLALRSRCPTVVTLHDLAYLHDQGDKVALEWLNKEECERWKLRARFFAEIEAQTRDTVAAAAHLITVSQSTREQVLKHLGVSADKVTAIPLGLRPEVMLVPDAEKRAEVGRRLAMPADYFLYLGGLDPNKNLQTLLAGFEQYRRRGGRYSLVLAGKSAFFGSVLRARARQWHLEDAVKFTGGLSEADLPSVYRNARAVIMPSLLEGFGLPALEAMACGVAVIASRAGALPEVVGDAAILVDGSNPEAFADAMLCVQDDAVLVQALKASGLKRAAVFRWEKTARKTLDVYRKVLNGAFR